MNVDTEKYLYELCKRQSSEIARLKTRVQEQNERIEQLLRDNADLRDALHLVERIFGEWLLQYNGSTWVTAKYVMNYIPYITGTAI